MKKTEAKIPLFQSSMKNSKGHPYKIRVHMSILIVAFLHCLLQAWILDIKECSF